MAWTDIIGQERAKISLQRAIESKKIAHAYLFFGPDGVGKRALALEFAKVLQCKGGEWHACDECNACRKIDRMIHPDVHVYFPVPKETPRSEITARLNLLAENPYAEIDFVRLPSLKDPQKKSNRQPLYTIEYYREEIRGATIYQPHEGNYKVAIITDAELFNQRTANAFLKLLEEPNPKTIFILTSSRPDKILPTISSRCQRLRFDALNAVMIEQALMAREGLTEGRAKPLSRMAGGSYSRALELSKNDELAANRALVVDFLRQSYALNALTVAATVEKINSHGREQIRGLLELMLGWVRDLMLYRTVGEDAPIVNVDMAESVRKFCQSLPDADLDAMAERIEQAIEMVSRNVHVGLTLTVLAHTLNRAMRGIPTEPLGAPLTDARAGTPATQA